ncbi:MAG: hypothetical protein ACI86M_000649 [Saprospiraceae bacterium]|jgi:hypothetical protein
MRTKINLGIWLDHSNAHLIEINSKMDNHSIKSKFYSGIKVDALRRSEGIMRKKELQMHEAYYKKIGKVILNYDHILLFGHTDARIELHSYLRRDLNFEDIIIDTVTADSMTNKEQHVFVDNHFLDFINNGPL